MGVFPAQVLAVLQNLVPRRVLNEMCLCGEPINSPYHGKEGIIKHIDDIGQLHGTWGGLSIIPGTDNFKVINHNNGNK